MNHYQKLLKKICSMVLNSILKKLMIISFSNSQIIMKQMRLLSFGGLSNIFDRLQFKTESLLELNY